MATCTVYARAGDARLETMSVAAADEPARHVSAASVPLTSIMRRDVLCARPDLEIAEVVRLMIGNRIGCVPVVDERRRPIGVITKFDLVEQLDAIMQSSGRDSPLPQDLAARIAEEAMMPIAFVLEEHATVAHAAAIMHLEDTHHVLIVRASGELIGVVSSKDIVVWMVRNEGIDRTMEES